MEISDGNLTTTGTWMLHGEIKGSFTLFFSLRVLTTHALDNYTVLDLPSCILSPYGI